MKTSNIKPGMMVHAEGDGEMKGKPGIHLGTVDRVEGNFVKLTKDDSDDGRHHWFPVEWIENISHDCVYVDRDPQDFFKGLLDSRPEAA